MRVVVVGGGYGGLRAALRLAAYLPRASGCSLSLIDLSDSHVLTTELHEAVSARVACMAIRVALRPLLESRGIEFVQGEVKDLDLEKRVVYLKEGEVGFDRLVLAPGSVPDFRGNGRGTACCAPTTPPGSVPEWQVHLEGDVPGARQAYLFRDFHHACRLRMRMQKCFADAAKESSKEARRGMLTFLVAGGGSTGVELAGELIHRLRWLARETGVDGSEVRVILLEATDHLVPDFNLAQGRRARQALETSGVEVRLGSRVVGYEGEKARLEFGEEVFAPTLVWTAGVRGSPLVGKAGLRVDSLGRAIVNPFMQAEGSEHIYVVGDSAAARDKGGQVVRAGAQVALQEAEAAAWNIASEFAGQEKKECYPKRRAFLVSCGGSEAVGWAGPLRVSGSLAWLLKEGISARYLLSLRRPGLFRRIFKQKLEGYGHRHE